MTCWPGPSDESGKVAVPAERLTVPRSVCVVLSRNSTVPVGVPKPGVAEVTVALSVTDWP